MNHGVLEISSYIPQSAQKLVTNAQDHYLLIAQNALIAGPYKMDNVLLL